MIFFSDSEKGFLHNRSPRLDEMETLDASSSCSDNFSSHSRSSSSSPRPNSKSPANPQTPTSPLNHPHDDHESPNSQQSQVEIKLELEESPSLPKLRLNAILASDPALQPYAKDIKQPEPVKLDDELLHPPLDQSIGNPISGAFVPANFAELILRDSIRPKPITSPAAERSGYTCAPCGIKFSSLSTLEAHQTYYCSHNRKEGCDVKENVKKAAAGVIARVPHVMDASDEPPVKQSRVGKHYACNQCSYSADKKVSLNRHMRMHQLSPAASSGTSNGGDSISDLQLMQSSNPLQHPPSECYYCNECDIRFSSLKTYRAHKLHYCSERHRDG